MTRYGLRKIKAPSHEEGDQTSEALRERHVVNRYILRTTYSVVVTGGSGAGAPHADAAYRFVNFIQVLTGRNTIHFVNGHTLGKLVKLWLPEEYAQTDPSDDAAATYSDLESTIMLPMFMFGSQDPDEFGFPSQLTKAEIVVNWAAGADLFTQAADFTSADIQSAVPQLYERPVLGASRSPGEYGSLSIIRKELTISAAGSESLDLTHLRPGMELRAVIVETFGNAVAAAKADEYADDVVTDLRLEINGRDEVETTPFSVLQNENKVAYGLASRETGVAVYDAAENGKTTRRSNGGSELPVIGDGEPPVIHLDVATPTAGNHKAVVTTVAGVRGARQVRART